MAQRFDRAEAAAHAAPAAQASAGSCENALDQFLGDGGKALALLGREILHFGEALAQQAFALLVEAAAKVVDNRAGLERRAPALRISRRARR